MRYRCRRSASHHIAVQELVSAMRNESDRCHRMDRGQFANVPPEVREWFEHLQSPKGVPCCSYADGHRTGYDTRQDQYWVPIEGEWYPVPPEAIIKTANPVGEAIVWYLSLYNDGTRTGPKYRILCFVPSDGV